MADPVVRATEARRISEGDLLYREAEELVRAALVEKFRPSDGYLWIRDLNDEYVIFEVEGDAGVVSQKISYTISDDKTVTLTGELVNVVVSTTYEEIGSASEARAFEARDVLYGRVIEAKGTAPDGGRIFACQIIEAGTSKNGVHYPEPVLHAAATLYEGAKAFDHHRTESELRTSSTSGLVGSWRNVTPISGGLAGNLHLLPSATHVAEALDASVAAVADGLPPVVGISHDVQIQRRPATIDGARVQEATSIVGVLSADVVSDPAAGGRPTRVVAGGITADDTPSTTPTPPTKGDAMTLKELLDKLREADAAARAELLKEHGKVLEDAGFTADDVPVLLGDPAGGAPEPTPTEPTDAEPVAASHTTESTMGRLLINQALADAKLDPARFAPLVAKDLGARFTEAELAQAIVRNQRVAEALELPGLAPTVPHVRVTEETLDKKREKVQRTLEGNYQEGYHSLHAMYVDVMGLPQSRLYGSGDDDLARIIVAEAWSGRSEGRARESADTSSFGEILADALNKRLVSEYRASNLQTWRQIVSTAPVRDFRSQKLTRVGGYGVLPTVNEGAPYQSLTTPGDEQATYTPSKKGGTEDFTYEAAKNDDLRALVQIPVKLGRAAAQTIYRAVWDLLDDNVTLYDSVALFDNGHANTGTSLTLSQSSLSTVRRKMREQAAYGDSYDILGLVPRFLVVPPELEEIAFQLARSAVAIPSSGNDTNIPNIHSGIEPIVVDYFTEADRWYAICDPRDCPTIEVGFMDGREEPELFVQDDPRVGASFSSDKVTWKIRHIYGLTVVDYRGFQRGETS